MHDELTQVDIDKMQAELEHRIHDLRPKLIEEVKVARSFGDLSENFENKAATREKNEAVVNTQPTATTNMTGLCASMRGSSLRKASLAA